MSAMNKRKGNVNRILNVWVFLKKEYQYLVEMQEEHFVRGTENYIQTL